MCILHAWFKKKNKIFLGLCGRLRMKRGEDFSPALFQFHIRREAENILPFPGFWWLTLGRVIFLLLGFFPWLFFLKLQQVVNDCQRIVLKLGVQFVKEADYPFPFFHRGTLKHLPSAVFEPCLIHPECEPDKPYDTVIGFSVPVLNFRRITAADTDSPQGEHYWPDLSSEVLVAL